MAPKTHNSNPDAPSIKLKEITSPSPLAKKNEDELRKSVLGLSFGHND